MISIDTSLFIQIVNFLFLIWVLNVILYRPIRNVLIQRKENIDKLQEGIDIYKNNAKDREKSFLEGIKNAKLKGLRERDDIAKIASEEENRILQQMNEKMQSDLESMRGKIAKEVESARIVLEKEIDGFAKAIGQKILGRAI